MPHAPGPWTFEDSQHVYDADACQVCIVLDTFVNGQNIKPGNAALIAAAPDLLEALIVLVEASDLPDYETSSKNRAARRAKALIANFKE